MTLRRLTFAFVSLVIGLAGCSRSPDRRPAAVDDLVAANNRGVGLMGQFDYAQARDIFARLAASHPDRLDVQVNLAVATLNRQREGDDREAQRILQKVLSVDPRQVRAHYNLGLILLNDGRPAEALGHFLLASEHERGDAYAVYYVGQCKFQQGDAAGALDAYQRALTLNPRLRSAAYGAFQAMQRLGRADASRMLDRFRTLDADPRSDAVEFKYTRMGPLGQAAIVDQPAPSAAQRPAGPVFQPNPVPIAVTSPTVTWRRFTATQRPSITAADIDGDGTIDLFIAGAIEDHGVVRNAVLLNRGASGFVLDATHPLAAVPDVNAALWGDYDNDGLTDVYLCRHGANQLWRQIAKGQWADVTASAHADGGGGTTIDGALFDADHDGDLDILLIKTGAANELLNNDGNGTFRSLGATIGLARDRRPSTGVIVADLDGDRDADIVVIRSSPQHDVLINDRTWQYHRGTGVQPIRGRRDDRGCCGRSRRRCAPGALLERSRRRDAMGARLFGHVGAAENRRVCRSRAKPAACGRRRRRRRPPRSDRHRIRWPLARDGNQRRRRRDAALRGTGPPGGRLDAGRARSSERTVDRCGAGRRRQRAAHMAARRRTFLVRVRDVQRARPHDHADPVERLGYRHAGPGARRIAVDRAVHVSRAVGHRSKPSAARIRYGRSAAARFPLDHMVRRRLPDRARARARNAAAHRRSAAPAIELSGALRVRRAPLRVRHGHSRRRRHGDADEPRCVPTSRGRAKACCCPTACSPAATAVTS